ncbi:MAG TPA: VOC family protein [Streptosporangiaceae bacterium]
MSTWNYASSACASTPPTQPGSPASGKPRWAGAARGRTKTRSASSRRRAARKMASLQTLIFLKVPEGKTVKNRLHLDLRPADQDAEVARLQALGARQVSIGQGDVSWVVMADPDGNEFDVLQPLTPDELPPGHDALGRRIAAGDRA